jgi:hypothetical protein
MEEVLLLYVQDNKQIAALIGIVVTNLVLTLAIETKKGEFDWTLLPKFASEIGGIGAALFVIWLFAWGNSENEYLFRTFTTIYDGAWIAFSLKYFTKIVKKLQILGVELDTTGLLKKSQIRSK